MKYTNTSFFILLGFILSVALIHTTQTAIAQDEPGLGWIEGVIVTNTGQPAAKFCAGQPNGFHSCNQAEVTIRSKSGKKISAMNDLDTGGFYTFRNLQPGVYEVFVSKTVQAVRGEWVGYRPQHIFGVAVEPNKRTRLNITVNEGSALEEIGQPIIETQQAIILSEELVRLQSEIDKLKKKLGVQ
jgi:hypothetical protein